MKITMKNKKLNLSTLDFYQALFLLRTFYKKLIDILEAFCGGAFTFRNENINLHYASLNEMINQLLRIDGLTGFKKDIPELFESLIGDIEEADMYWKHHYSKKAYRFLGKIENLYIKAGAKNFELPQESKDYLEMIDKAIAAHREHNKRLQGKLETTMQKFDWSGASSKEQPEKDKKLIEFIKNKNEATLKISNYNAIRFTGLLRCKLIDFFYNSDGRKEWKNYDDIKEYLSDNHKSEDIRKAIGKINDRVAEHTNNEFKEIIETKETDDLTAKSPKMYRWKF